MEIDNKTKYYGAFLLFFLFWSWFFLSTKSIFSGYHWIDDHEILNINRELASKKVTEEIKDLVIRDLSIRFRPLYYSHRVVEVKIFGDNFVAWSVYNAFLALLTSFFLFLFLKFSKFSFGNSVLFSFLSLVGYQSVIWWRLGPVELIGVFLLSVALLFLGLCISYPDKKKYNFLFIVFVILASLCKESFIVIIPALVSYKILAEKQIFNITIKKSIQNNLLLVVPITVMIVELGVIVFVIGTNKIGYAGSTSSVTALISGMWTILTSETMLANWMKFIIILIFCYFLSFLFIKNDKWVAFKQSMGRLLAPLTFALLVLLSNLVLYAKSGMVEHYLLPTTLGLAFLVIGVLSNIGNKVLQKLAILVVIFFIVVFLRTAINGASSFTNEGVQINTLLSTIKEQAKPGSKILLAVDPVNRFEVSWSLKTYLTYNGIGDLYGYPLLRDYSSDFERNLERDWEGWFKNKNLQNMDSEPDLIVIIDKTQAEDFFSQSKIPKSDYENLLSAENWYALYSRN